MVVLQRLLVSKSRSPFDQRQAVQLGCPDQDTTTAGVASSVPTVGTASAFRLKLRMKSVAFDAALLARLPRGHGYLDELVHLDVLLPAELQDLEFLVVEILLVRGRPQIGYCFCHFVSLLSVKVKNRIELYRMAAVFAI